MISRCIDVFYQIIIHQLPKAKETAAMSGAGFMRLVKNVGESISKMAGKKSDSDKVS